MVFKQIRKNSLFFVAFFGVFFILGIIAPPAAFAVNNEQNCKFESKLKQIEAVQNDETIGYMEKLQVELKLRKELLKNTIDCAVIQIKELQTDLKVFSISETGLKQAQTNLIDELNQVINYYQTQKAKIDDIGIRGSQEIARNIKDWRSSNYVILVQKTANFVIWLKNQELIQVAQNRLDQINRTVYVLKLVDDQKIQELFKQAKLNFEKTKEYNQKAKESLERFSNPNDSLVFIKTSLELLSQTYQSFFDISERVNELLPH